MKTTTLCLTLLISLPALAQSNTQPDLMDGRNYGVVLEHPQMKNVTVHPDIPYLQDAKGTFKLDLYASLDLRKGEKRPAIVF